MHFTDINFLPVRSGERYLSLLKMAEDIIISGLPYETPKPDAKRQKLLECVLTRNSKLYLGKAYTKEQISKVSEEEVENCLIITKLNSQVIP